MSRADKPALTAWQRRARTELRNCATANPGNLQIVGEHGVGDDGSYRATIRLPTGELPAEANGLAVNAHEDVVVGIHPTPLVPPMTVVTHNRFAGHSHVLQGDRLCVYLDQSREWNPTLGMTGFLEQLWQFFCDAVAGRFDPAVALFHPVGGVVHQTAGTSTVVIRGPFPDITKPFTRAQLRQRSDHRLDLRWDVAPEAGMALAAVVVMPVALHYGAGTTLPQLLMAIAGAGHPEPSAVLRFFAATACRNPQGSPLYFVLAVPNKAGGHHHLVVGRLPSEVADELRKLVSLSTIDPSRIPPETAIEWCSVSDERPEITTRRDTDRPVNGFRGRKVHIWGCGGLGSWIAEFIARAGAAHIVVCDPGSVLGGLLVRQNYTEDDIGMKKAQALAARLRAISDTLVVDAVTALLPHTEGNSFLPDCDVLIDATVSVALGALLDGAARDQVGARPLMTQVATDSRTGTLGILTIAPPDHVAGPATIDREIGQVVLAGGGLERFHPLWEEPSPGDEIIPARGCSTPTFHGSAADLASVAGSLVSLLGPHLSAPTPGTHLIAASHAGGGPAHVFLNSAHGGPEQVP